jgi:hypothetical protein
MPTIRTIHPADLVSLVSFFRNEGQREVTAQVWPEVDDSHPALVRGVLSRWIARPGRSQIWVCLESGGIHALVAAGPRAGKLAWDVKELYVTEGDRSAGVDLLDHLAAEAAKRGARRVFLTISIDSGMARIATHAGFVNYTSEGLYSLQSNSLLGDEGPGGARPRLRQDTQPLFQLYNAAVPCRVRSAEAMTIDEWLSLEKGPRLWAPSLADRRQHLVWEKDGVLIGWLKITFGRRSQHLELLTHPSYREATEEMVRHSLSLVSRKLPIYFSARDYQPEILAALEGRGFTRVSEYLVFARELAARVPHRALIPARA